MKLRKRIAAILLAACTLLGAAPVSEAKAASAKIPSSAVTYGTSKYKVFSGSMTYSEAERYCESRGGHLATISSKKENTFLMQYLRQSKCTSAYFGATDYRKSGTWRDVYGNKLSWSNWKLSLKAMLKSGGKHYAMLMNSNGKWVNGNFSGKSSFLCEWDNAGTPSAPKVTSIKVRTGVVRGTCSKGTTVKLTIGAKTYSAKTNSAGVFQFKLNYKNLKGWKTMKLYSQGNYGNKSKVVSYRAYFFGSTR